MEQHRLRQHAMTPSSLYHNPTLIIPPHIEPILGGNLPPCFDSSTCHSVYVGNINPQVKKAVLKELFASAGALEGCKLIHKENSSYAFVHYYDHSSAAIAIVNLNGRNIFGQPIKVNWAYSRSKRENTSSHFNIFIGDLSPEVTDATLYAFFSAYSSRSDARVMWDHKTGNSLGYGFVSFRNQQDAQSAIIDLTGKWLGTRRIRCNWATKGANVNDENQSSSIMPTPPRTVSIPLPRPTSSQVPGFALSDLAEYELQMAHSKMSGAEALLHQQNQHALKQAAMGMGALGAGYGTGFPSVATTQHLIYY